MSGDVFVDTNVFVYARDLSETDKQARADAWLTHLWTERRGRISWQVMQEFYSVVTGKLKPGMAPELARRHVRALLAWRPIVADAALIERAWDLQDRHRLSWWDALIVAAAQAAGCRYLLSEDLQEGADLDGVTILNPFSSPPP